MVLMAQEAQKITTVLSVSVILGQSGTLAPVRSLSTYITAAKNDIVLQSIIPHSPYRKEILTSKNTSKQQAMSSFSMLKQRPQQMRLVSFVFF